MKALELLDWGGIQNSLDREGYASVRGLLCDADREALLESDVPALHELHAMLYRRLVPIANRWNVEMGLPPMNSQEEQEQPVPPKISVSRLFEGQHQPLGQDLDGPDVFPLRATVLLSRPGRDFDGGELVMTEQRPRMQSRAIVVPLDRGDAAFFAGSRRPVQGGAGIYRVSMRHAVSRVTRGTRTALNFMFQRAS